MIVVSGTIVINPDKRDRAVELTRELMARTREEPGNLSYEFYGALEDPGRFRVFEEWESQDAIDAHNGSEHYAAFLGAAGDIEISSVELHQYEIADSRRIM